MVFIASHEFAPGELPELLTFLKRMRAELRMLRKVHVYPHELRIIDINGDCFQVCGLGYADPDIIEVLDTVNTAYKRAVIHDPTDDEFKEFKTGRRYCWAADRVM
jgi:hypothetical protein